MRDSYRLVDVQIRDQVMLDCGLVNGEWVFNGIRINRRPGGRVPPAPGDYDDGPFKGAPKWHDGINALQDWEERGIPIPDKYHPRGNQAGIAPMPREPIPRISHSAP